MNDYILIYLITLCFIAVLVALLLVYRYYLGNRLIQQSKKLQLLMNKIPRDSLEMLEKPSNLISSGLGDIGIEGIMNELGIDPGILKNPLVKGLIEKYAPRVLEGLNKKTNNNQGFELL